MQPGRPVVQAPVAAKVEAWSPVTLSCLSFLMHPRQSPLSFYPPVRARAGARARACDGV